MTQAHQPLCEILEPAELLSRWGFPIEVEIWVEAEYEASEHASRYNYRTQIRGLDREKIQPIPVPYRVGLMIILNAQEIEWHLVPDAVASVDVIALTTRRQIENTGVITLLWKHLGWLPLPESSLISGDPLFPLALIFDLVEEGFVPKVNGLSGREIDDALGYWVSRKYWMRTIFPPQKW